MESGYSSDFQKLKNVLMHEPGEEINIIDNPHKWLFLEKPSLEKMKKEYRAVLDIFRSASVKVMKMKTHVPDVPNLLFTRDLGVFFPAGFYQCCLKEEVRKKESALIRDFVQNMKFPVHGGENKNPIEGGDIIFLNKKTVVVGESARTTKKGIENFRMYVKKEVITVPIPKNFIHLDLIFNVLSKDTCLAAQGALPAEFIHFLEEQRYMIITAKKNEIEKTAVNVLSLDEKKVLAHAGNKKTNRLLADHGFDVLTVDASEILKGGGGIRCITLPILRL